MGWFTPSRNSSSFFGGYVGGGDKHHRSHSPRSSVSHAHSSYSRSSSYYKRRPRDGYLARLLHKLRHFVRELVHYAKRHPFKAALAVLGPLLVSGGILHQVSRNFGFKLPHALKGLGLGGSGHGSGGFPMADLMGGSRHGGAGMDGYYGSSGYSGSGGGSQSGGLGGLGAVVGSLGGLGTLVSVAKAFM